MGLGSFFRCRVYGFDSVRDLFVLRPFGKANYGFRRGSVQEMDHAGFVQPGVIDAAQLVIGADGKGERCALIIGCLLYTSVPCPCKFRPAIRARKELDPYMVFQRINLFHY